ncbi:hypothetical protein OS121_13165 [Mycolicibacterium mucogenicum]|uniref:hypothetical protein n=1 Tax=Mycolicibacterium mucogenicum TaxID=56689 RepID=UPI00226ADB18|nr:hypothetical protein [Mycolicibacterium mucogenicum]MCX8556034.1 hypothetical protein [Mycolicibacterium mucogenicum]
MQQNETNPWQSDGPLDAGRWIPLVTLAIEGFGTGLIENGFDRRYERLRYELRDEILCDDVGIPHIPRTLAATMIRERTQALAEQKARIEAQQARFDAQHNAERARILAMGRPMHDGMTAHEVMTEDETYEGNDDKALMAFGVSTGGTFGPHNQ